MSRVAQGIDNTLLWAARVVGLLLLCALIYLAAKVLVGAVVILLVFVATVAVVFAMIRGRRRAS